MVSCAFKEVLFVTSAATNGQFPTIKSDSGELLPEVAVVGRSNVGKSSLLNLLFRKKNLARVSATPGKTQLINFFKVDNDVVFADLPGYGYAKVPNEMKISWGPLIQKYLEKREQLKLILFLFDIRRDPSPEDKELMEWLFHYNKPFILVLTKKDKINKTSLLKRIKDLLKQFPQKEFDYCTVSSLTGDGKDTFVHLIKSSLNQ